MRHCFSYYTVYLTSGKQVTYLATSLEQSLVMAELEFGQDNVDCVMRPEPMIVALAGQPTRTE